MNRPIRTRDMKPAEVRQSFAERFRIAGRDWAVKDAQYEKLKNMRSPMREAIKQRIAREQPGLTDSKLERLALADGEYVKHIAAEAYAAELANLAWVERKAVEMEAHEQGEANANYRHEQKLYQRG